jgi:hypothetical protein
VRKRLFLVVVAVFANHGCVRKSGPTADATSVLNAHFDKEADTRPLFIPVGKLSLRGKYGPFGTDPDITRGEVDPESPFFLVYKNLEQLGIIRLDVRKSSGDGSPLQTLHSNLWGQSGSMDVEVTDQGARYLCTGSAAAELSRKAPGLRCLCAPRGAPRVDRIAADQDFVVGGEKYRWIRAVTTVVGDDALTKAFYDLRKIHRSQKISAVFKLDPFTRQWTSVDDLWEQASITEDLEGKTAHRFFTLSALAEKAKERR